MKTLVSACLLVGTLAGMAFAQAEGNAVVNGNNAFAVDLYHRLAEEPGNLFFSPFSSSVALAMTHAGARGETAEEMAKVLHLPAEPDAPFKALLEALMEEKDRPYQLNVANALWLQEGDKFLQEYLDRVEKHYDAGLFNVDYARDTEGVRERINEWVEDQTADKIQDLLAPGLLSSSTRLVLTNAIYFKGDWVSAFDPKRTEEGPFHLSADKSVNVPMMSQRGSFAYLQGEGFQALEMPYAGDALSMVILLPDEVDGLAVLEQSLNVEKLQEWMEALDTGKQTVVVSVPRFKATSEFSLADILATLGMRSAFGGGADFSGMTGKRDLFISAVVHKAYADVNEKGTEAAAATGVVMKRALAAPPKQFLADHPFIYLIRDRRSGSILFLGRLAQPPA